MCLCVCACECHDRYPPTPSPQLMEKLKSELDLYQTSASGARGQAVQRARARTHTRTHTQTHTLTDLDTYNNSIVTAVEGGPDTANRTCLSRPAQSDSRRRANLPSWPSFLRFFYLSLCLCVAPLWSPWEKGREGGRQEGRKSWR